LEVWRASWWGGGARICGAIARFGAALGLFRRAGRDSNRFYFMCLQAPAHPETDRFADLQACKAIERAPVGC